MPINENDSQIKSVNAADPAQVNKMRFQEKETRRRQLKDIAAVLSTEEGRRFVWRIMEKCKTFASIYDETNMIYYNSGRQDLGHFIMAEIAATNEDFIFKMMLENKKRIGRG